MFFCFFFLHDHLFVRLRIHVCSEKIPVPFSAHRHQLGKMSLLIGQTELACARWQIEIGYHACQLQERTCTSCSLSRHATTRPRPCAEFTRCGRLGRVLTDVTQPPASLQIRVFYCFCWCVQLLHELRDAVTRSVKRIFRLAPRGRAGELGVNIDNND